ncbi:MAG: hypothetical protein ACYDC6_09665 [Acidobacteriaceae bacterium]
MPLLSATRSSTLLLAAAILTGVATAQTSTAPTPQPATQQQSQQPTSQQTIGHIDPSATVEKIQVSGAVTLSGESTLLGNGSTVTAGMKTLPIHLTRGGELDLCSTTGVHLSQQNNPADPNSPLMLALDHGAIEAHYKLGTNSDVVMTPDLRILLSGPGEANVSIRVNAAGDTCVDNAGKDAPYLTVSEQMGPGVYRVQPNQRVMFEHGSVHDVVDRETQPCGCPVTPVVSIASAGASSQHPAAPGQSVARSAVVGGPSSTPADTAFPLAESEGLVPPPAAPKQPAVAPGVVQSQVTTTLSYTAPQQAVPTGLPSGMATPESAATTAAPEALTSGNIAAAITPGTAQTPPAAHPHPGIFHKIGRFFARIFG